MERFDLDLSGVCLLRPRVFRDERGFFTERFREDLLASLGVKETWIQDNFSRSAHGVLRGLHFQWDPPQGKLVTCTRGKIFDVVVDLRSNSPTFGQHAAVALSGDEPQWLWIPAGFAHGFLVTSTDGADLLYKVNSHWSAKGEGCISWNDPELAIDWPIKIPMLSTKDCGGMSWRDFSAGSKALFV